MATRFILRLRLSTEHHYVFNPSPSLKRVELPLNEQIFNTIGIRSLYMIIFKLLILNVIYTIKK
ncbi:hypothetical protein [Shewanella glacialipiscicola]|uniref:hypothetical protein n=1 Tax=Shewanella glacialipiscicola TaxID=614069 RepID=UPI001FE34B6B|nr:hypothetical protein [Shewanella glacialipiscicola]MCL1087840.1 hypothetical protein [Shewanella glacialipiscicola]